jgi:hypothetical protein
MMKRSNSYESYPDNTFEPLPNHIKEALDSGLADPERGLSLADTNELLRPGYLPLETGFTRLPNGQMYVAVLTKMPGTKGNMIDWWFGYAGDTEKYKMWHPKDHVVGEWDEKWRPGHYIGASHLVHEYLGEEFVKLRITFREPAEYFDTSRFAEGNVSAVVCGRVGFLDKPLDFAHVIHFVRDTDEGCEMRSRFWSGDIRFRLPFIGPALSNMANTPFIRKRLVKEQIGRNLTIHCAEEMNRLSGFLPELYHKMTDPKRRK